MNAILGKSRAGGAIEIDELVLEHTGCAPTEIEGLDHIQALIVRVESKHAQDEITEETIERFVKELCDGIKKLAWKGLIKLRL